MKIEVLIVLLVAIVGGVVLYFCFSKKENTKYDLSNEMSVRVKSNLPNTYARCSGENEARETAEYKEIIDCEVVKLLRRESRL